MLGKISTLTILLTQQIRLNAFQEQDLFRWTIHTSILTRVVMEQLGIPILSANFLIKQIFSIEKIWQSKAWIAGLITGLIFYLG